MFAEKSDKGFALLEWTGTLIPQGLLVKGAPGSLLPFALLQVQVKVLPGIEVQRRSKGRLEAGLADHDEGAGTTGVSR